VKTAAARESFLVGRRPAEVKGCGPASGSAPGARAFAVTPRGRR